MKITLLANHDLAANYALNLLLPKLQPHQLTLFLSTRVGSAKLQKPQALLDMAAMEQQSLDNLGAPGSSLKSFSQLNHFLSSPWQMLDNINRPEGLTLLQQTQADLIISIRFGKILRSQAIACARHGVLNLHSGLLPDYRGVMATFWAMLNQEKTIGTTLHYVPDSNIDTGDIIGQTQLRIEPSKSYQWHVLKLYQKGCSLIAQTVDAIDRGQVVQKQKQPQAGNYFSYPEQQDLARFFALGLKLTEQSQLNQFLTPDRAFS